MAGNPASSSSAALFACAKAPPPTATTLAEVAQFPDQRAQGRMLQLAKCGFSRLRENLLDGPCVPEPECARPDPQKASPTCGSEPAPTLLLPAPMKPTKKYGPRLPETGAELVVSGCPPGLSAHVWRQICGAIPTLRQPLKCCLRFNARLFKRFLRWILPLKENNRTEDAALFIVPAKALPALTTKGVCLGSSRKSFSTWPRTERAVTSIEASLGALASISPLWLAR